MQRASRQVSRRHAEAELNVGLGAICADRSSWCSEATIVCVTLNVDCDHLVADGVHPSNSGAVQMAAAWYAALSPVLGILPADASGAL